MVSQAHLLYTQRSNTCHTVLVLTGFSRLSTWRAFTAPLLVPTQIQFSCILHAGCPTTIHSRSHGDSACLLSAIASPNCSVFCFCFFLITFLSSQWSRRLVGGAAAPPPPPEVGLALMVAIRMVWKGRGLASCEMIQIRGSSFPGGALSQPHGETGSGCLPRQVKSAS